MMQFDEQSPQKILQFPHSCVCQYLPQISAYRCSFQVKNLTPFKLFLNVNSTFYRFLQIQSGVQELSQGQSKIFIAKIRPPNQIYPNQQFIIFSYALCPPSSFISILNWHSAFKIKLQFNSQITQDLEIDNILKQQSQITLQGAVKLYKNSQFKNAKQMAEEAFILYRKNISSLITIAESEQKLKEIANATKTIDLIFCHPDNQLYYKAIVIKAQTILFVIETIPKSQKLRVIKKIMNYLKKVNQSQMVDQDYEKRCIQAMTQFQNIKHQLLSQQKNQYFKQLLVKAIQNFDKNAQIKQKFLNKQQFTKFINEKAIQQHQIYEQTPQYALDPVNYQIFKDPVITPTGVSYQKTFIMNFFQKHGPQDPFTRTYLDPHIVFHNHALKSLVRNNPNLQKWMKYEQEATKM